MLKKIWLGLATMTLLFGLVGCASKLPKAEDAVSAMINSEIYNKDDDKYEEYFHLKLDKTETVFDEVSDDLVSQGIPVETADELVEELINQIRANTSFEIVDSETKDKITTVTVNVFGIDVADFEKNIEEITMTQIIKNLNDLGFQLEDLDNIDEFANNLSEAEFEEFAEHFNNSLIEGKLLSNVMLQGISELKQSEKPSEYQVMLKVNKDNKDSWEIINHEVTVNQLGTLLFNFK